MIADEVFRARFHSSFEHPEAVTPNRVTEYPIDLHTNDDSFLKGHRVTVELQSAWFPFIDRNPQKADYQQAAQRVYHSRSFPSAIEIPVMRR